MELFSSTTVYYFIAKTHSHEQEKEISSSEDEGRKGMRKEIHNTKCDCHISKYL